MVYELAKKWNGHHGNTMTTMRNHILFLFLLLNVLREKFPGVEKEDRETHSF